ncbi:MAG TPA: PLP-dependent aminotransferase family protein [Bacillus bacterium]|nr:PLP-dependent aminotransferase family protein [Bacillus sp. (in: firmicutes)]
MIELTPIIDKSSDEAVYIQLYHYIRGEIVAGRIVKGSKLPSIRRLAAHLGISRTPVELAFEQLIAEGYIKSKPRCGFFAVEVDSFISSQKSTHLMSSSSDKLSLPHFYHAYQDKLIQYDFGYGNIDLAHFPLTKWRRIMNRCLLPENSQFLLYGNVQGERELRVEIASYLHQIRGVRCLPEQIVIGAGTYHSLDLLFQLIKRDIINMGVEKSVNIGVKALLEQFQFNCIPLELESDGIRIEDVYNSNAQGIYVTPSHQFPYGMTLSVNKRIKLLKWAQERRAYIIENDYGGEFRYNGRPIPSLQSLDDFGRVIYMGTFSKSLTPSFRISYLVLPPELLEKFLLRKHSYDQLASPIFQKTLQWFMESGDFERHVRKMKRLYHKKHDAMLQAVAKVFQDDVEVIGAGAGLHIMLKVENEMNEAELIHTAKQLGVKVYPTSIYELENSQNSSAKVLLGFGGLSEAEIFEGIELLKQAWFN